MLSPHQDDETIGCGILMAEKASRGIPVAVAVATDGHPWLVPADHRDRHLTRSPRSAAVNGIGPSMSWGCLKRIVSNSVSPTANWADHQSEVTDRIGALLRSVRPSQVFVTRPGDAHPDHHALAQATRQAVRSTIPISLSQASITNFLPLNWKAMARSGARLVDCSERATHPP